MRPPCGGNLDAPDPTCILVQPGEQVADIFYRGRRMMEGGRWGWERKRGGEASLGRDSWSRNASGTFHCCARGALTHRRRGLRHCWDDSCAGGIYRLVYFAALPPPSLLLHPRLPPSPILGIIPSSPPTARLLLAVAARPACLQWDAGRRRPPDGAGRVHTAINLDLRLREGRTEKINGRSSHL